MHRRYKICSKHFKQTDFRNPNLTSQGFAFSCFNMFYKFID